MVKRTKVFVYGTLKKGFCNHYLLKRYKGKPAIAPELDLHYGFLPMAIRGNGIVKGELYVIDIKTLEKLDCLEGHPRFYERIELPIIADDTEVIAWIYLCKQAKRYPLVESGEFIK